MELEVLPLTKERWPDLVELFNRPGASLGRNCWCMWYRKSGPMTPSETNKKAMKSVVDRGQVPGLIGYLDGRPVGWISLGPREDYEKLKRSSVMKPVDEKPVWSIICFFVDSKTRGKGVAKDLLRGAIDYARAQGVNLIEAYPVDKQDGSPNWTSWFGTKPMFDREGFKEVARRSETRPVMRKSIRSKKAGIQRPNS